MKIDYFTQNAIAEAQEQNCFIQTIYHDGQGGNGIRISMWDSYDIKENRYVRHVRSYASNQYEKLQFTGMNVNAYLALSTHAGTRRLHSQLFNRSVFYIDLDGHEFTGLDLDSAKEKTRDLLNQAWNNKVLPVPTMITSTGRGYGVFYVLDRSIAATENTKKLMNLFDRIYKGLIVKYQEVLQNVSDAISVSDGSLINDVLKNDTLSVDKCVLDSSRIARLPGTMNLNCGVMCRLVGYIPNGYYTISDLKNFASVEQSKEPKTARRGLTVYHQANASIMEDELSSVGRSAVLKERIKRLERFSDLVKDETEYREFACFLVYNTAVQVYGEEAVQVLRRFNKRLKKPLEEVELDAIVKNLDKHIEESGSAYKYSDKCIVGSFKEKYENDLKQAGFGCGYKKVRDRAETHAANVSKRDALWDEIILCAKTNEDMTYAQIAEIYGRKENTIKKKLNSMGIYRYNVKKKDIQENGIEEWSDSDEWETVENSPFDYADSCTSKVDFNVPCIKYCVCDREDELRGKRTYNKLFRLHDVLEDERIRIVNQLIVEIDKGKWDKDPEIDAMMNAVPEYELWNLDSIDSVLPYYETIYNRIMEKLKNKTILQRQEKEACAELRKKEREDLYVAHKDAFLALHNTCMEDPDVYNPRIGKLFKHYYYVIYKDLKRKKGFQYTKDRWVSVHTVKRYLDALTLDEMKEIVKEASELKLIFHEYSYVLRMVIDVHERKVQADREKELDDDSSDIGA